MDSRDELAGDVAEIVAGNSFYVSSSNVAEVGPWDKDTETLTVTFKNGNVYEYYRVPLLVVVDFVNAPSPGQYVHYVMTPGYSFSRVG